MTALRAGTWRRGALALLLGLALGPGWARAPQAPSESTRDAALLSAQADAARRHLSRHAEAPSVVLVAAALDGSSKAFVGDVRLAESRLSALAPAMATLRLGNHGAPRDWPSASRRNVAEAIARAAELLGARPGPVAAAAPAHQPADGKGATRGHRAPTARAKDFPRLAIVLLTSHGDEGHLALETRRTRRLQLVPGRELRRWLQPLAGVPTLVIVSACHSGSLIPSLRGPHRIVMAAARHDRSSFGCETESHNTYFIDELFRALKPESSIEQWFATTARAVGEREARMKLSPPSQPQIDVGRQMRQAARRPLAELLGTPR